MQESCLQQLVEGLARCEVLTTSAANARVKEQANELANRYRQLIAIATKLHQQRDWRHVREGWPVVDLNIELRSEGQPANADILRVEARP